MKSSSNYLFSFRFGVVCFCLRSGKLRLYHLRKSSLVTRYIRLAGNKELGMWFTHAPSPRQLSRTLPLANLKSSCLLNPKKHAELFVTTIPKHIENNDNKEKTINWKFSVVNSYGNMKNQIWHPQEKQESQFTQHQARKYASWIEAHC